MAPGIWTPVRAASLAEPSGSASQVEAQASSTAEAIRIEHAPKLDGTLNDPLWELAKPITDFRHQEPLEGQPATEKTEVRILYTRHAVYFKWTRRTLKPSSPHPSSYRGHGSAHGK